MRETEINKEKVELLLNLKKAIVLSMTSRQCKNEPNRFCYIFDDLPFAKEKRSITNHTKKLYKAVFYWNIGDQDKSWAPHIALHV